MPKFTEVPGELIINLCWDVLRQLLYDYKGQKASSDTIRYFTAQYRTYLRIELSEFGFKQIDLQAIEIAVNSAGQVGLDGDVVADKTKASFLMGYLPQVVQEP